LLSLFIETGIDASNESKDILTLMAQGFTAITAKTKVAHIIDYQFHTNNKRLRQVVGLGTLRHANKRGIQFSPYLVKKSIILGTFLFTDEQQCSANLVVVTTINVPGETKVRNFYSSGTRYKTIPSGQVPMNEML